MNGQSLEKFWVLVFMVGLFLLAKSALAQEVFIDPTNILGNIGSNDVANQGFESLFQQKVEPVPAVTEPIITEEPAVDSTVPAVVSEQKKPVAPSPVKRVATSQKAIKVPVTTKGTKCPDEHDRPSWSRRNGTNHMDEDCCADYDEWPKPGCAYDARDFMLMLKGPTSGHKKHK